jgi:hypothetical protein
VDLSMAERKAVTMQMIKRYPNVSRTEKGRMLDELCELTGWTRRHARRALQGARTGAIDRPRKPKERTYGPDVLGPLRVVWAVLDGPSGKRLAPFMSEIVQALERAEELSIASEVRMKLLRVSPATIDRMLAEDRRRLRVKGRSGTKPGSMLKRQIPIRTFAQWDEDRPGFCEVDLVGHDGGAPAGEFCQTLDLTCVKTGWTEPRALKTKSQRWVTEALGDIEQDLPFPLLGVDCDNGGEFINVELFNWCADRGITFTRSRPYRKNDNCFARAEELAGGPPAGGLPALRHRSGAGLPPRAVRPSPALHQLLPAPDETGVQDARRVQADKALRLRPHALPAGTRLPRGHRGGQGGDDRDLPGAEPSGAQTGHRPVPGPADRDRQEQAGDEKGGGTLTGSPLQENDVLAAGFEDIFGEATGAGFEDILT